MILMVILEFIYLFIFTRYEWSSLERAQEACFYPQWGWQTNLHKVS